MPPKIKITKEEIVTAALAHVRSHGAESINARTLASALHCSTQPIFSNFASMDALRCDIVKEADLLCKEYIEAEVKSGKFPGYKASGMAYIRFAKEEKELFKLLFMRDRSQENWGEKSSLDDLVEGIVQAQTGLEGDAAKLFHLQMWACVHGIATMFATGYIDLDWELVSKMLTDAYLGHRKLYDLED